MQQDYYDHSADCTGTAIASDHDYQSVLEGNGNVSDYCFLMSCHNETYISYHGNTRIGSGKQSFFQDPEAPILLFVIGTSVLLVGFWVIYCYRKCCRATKEQV